MKNAYSQGYPFPGTRLTLLVLVIFIFWGCNGSLPQPPTAASVITPVEQTIPIVDLVRGAQDVNEAVMSYVETTDIVVTRETSSGSETRTARRVLTSIAGGGKHLVVTGTLDGYVETLYVSGKAYRRNAPDAAWTVLDELPRTEWSAGPMRPASHLKTIRDLDQPKLVGEQRVGGVRMWKIQGTVDPGLLAQRFPHAGILREEVEYLEDLRNEDLHTAHTWIGWVSQEDGLIHQHQVYSDYPAAGILPRRTYYVRTALSSLNTPLQLPSPGV